MVSKRYRSRALAHVRRILRRTALAGVVRAGARVQVLLRIMGGDRIVQMPRENVAVR